MHAIFAKPHEGKGFMGYLMLGFAGGLAALLVGAIFPSIIPARAKSVQI